MAMRNVFIKGKLRKLGFATGFDYSFTTRSETVVDTAMMLLRKGSL